MSERLDTRLMPVAGDDKRDVELPIDRAELARRLGIGVRTVSRMVERGELPRPCIGTGSRPRWLWSYVEGFLRKQHERAAELDRRTQRKTQ